MSDRDPSKIARVGGGTLYIVMYSIIPLYIVM